MSTTPDEIGHHDALGCDRALGQEPEDAGDLPGRTAVHLLPVRGSDTEWYKNLLKNRTIALAAKGAKWTARKVTVIKDRGRVRKVAEMFRAKHGAGDVKKYYTKFDVAVRIPLG